ncbi:IBR finger domain-containing protein [Rutstroemia sp. NJR-2017a WRK4]|nr:IBR finger domain-containing protein [Rutstroemia sp. NJR-2017a WRK4]
MTEKLEVAAANWRRECVACLDQFKNSKLVSLACHKYCKMCFATLVSASLASEDQWPVKCCTEFIPSADVLRHVSRKQQKKFLQREIEWSTPVDERIYCAAVNCGRFIPRSAIRKNKTCVRCQKCRTNVCTQCLRLWHGKDDCPNEVGLQDALILAESQGWKRCPNCRAMVSKNQGCRIIHCRCGGHFCYVCGNSCPRNGACVCEAAGPDGPAGAVAELRANAEAQSENSSEASSALAESIASTSSEDTQDLEEIERARIAVDNMRNRQVAEKVRAIHRRYAVATKELEGIHQKQRQLIYARWNRQEKQLSDDLQDAINGLEARAQRSLDLATKEYKHRLAYLQNLGEDFLSMEETIMIAEGKVVWADLNRRMISSVPNPYSEKENTKVKKEIQLQKKDKLGNREEQIEKYTEEVRKLVEECNQARDKTRAILDTIYREYEYGLSRIHAAEAQWMDAVMAERQSMLQKMENDEIAHASKNLQ